MKKQKTVEFETHELDGTCQELLTLAEEIQQEVNKLNETLFQMLEKKRKIFETMGNTHVETPKEVPKEKEELSEVPKKKEEKEEMTHVSTLFNQEFVVKSRLQQQEPQERSESSDVCKEVENASMNNEVPKCCRCSAIYSEASERYEHSAWKCAFCGNMNSSPNGFVFTYFKKQFPLFPALREEVSNNEVIIDLTNDEPADCSEMPRIQYEHRFTYVEDYVMVNGRVYVWVEAKKRGFYRPSIRKIHWHINGPKHATNEKMDESDEVILFDSSE